MLRSTHDTELAALKALLNRAEQARADAHQNALDAMRLHELERRRYDDLLQKFTELRLAGAEKPEPPPKLPEFKPDPVALAISRKAGANRTLRQHYAQEAHRLKSQNLTEDEIVAKIEAGDDATAWGIPA